MPAHRKPSNVLELSGAFRKNPARGRARSGEPDSNGAIGDPPQRLCPAEQALWHELAGLAYPGTLCRAHRWTLELAVKAMSLVIDGKARSADITNLRLLLASMGMSPADQSRVRLPERGATGNRFADV